MNLVKKSLNILDNNFFDDPYADNQILNFETPGTVLAKQETIGYLKLLKEKIGNDHVEKMEEIKSNHQQIMKSMQYQALNNYVSGLSSPDRLKIDSIIVLPFVEEKGFLGFSSRGPGITLKINK